MICWSKKTVINIKTFECTICQKVFYNTGHLKRHMVKVHHAKEFARYKCEFCSEGFSEMRDMANHRMKKHNATNVEVQLSSGPIHKCGICDQMFYHKKRGDEHKRKVS